MNESDKPEFRLLLTGLVETYEPASGGMSAARMRIYFEALAEHDLETVKRAVLSAIREPGRAFIPKPGELIALMPEDETALVAWERVVFAWKTVIAKTGAYWEDAVIGIAVYRIGGWARLLASSEDELSKWVRPKFIEEYNDAKKHGASFHPMRPGQEIIRCPYLAPIEFIEEAQSRPAIVSELAKSIVKESK